MTFILKSGLYFYLARCTWVGGKSRNKIIRVATDIEIKAYLESRPGVDMASMTCENPSCDKRINLPRKQKWRFKVTYPNRYGRFINVYCSQGCQDEHEKLLKVPKSISD